jgi:hypothetical protein
MSEDVDLEISAVDPSVPQADFYLFHPGYTENLQTTTKNRHGQLLTYFNANST